MTNTHCHPHPAVKLLKLLLLLLFISLLAPGCSGFSASGSETASEAEIFDSDTLLHDLNQCLMDGGTQLEYEYQTTDTLRDDIKAALQTAQSENYLCSCLLKEITTSYTQEKKVTSVQIDLTYSDQIGDPAPIITVSSLKELTSLLPDTFTEEKTQVMVLFQESIPTEEGLLNLLNNIAANCTDLPCEPDQISYSLYDPDLDSMEQLAILGIQLPVDTATLTNTKKKVTQAIQATVDEIRSAGYSDDTAAYGMIYDKVTTATEYNQSLADTTLSAPEALTEEMQLNRSAYGALITGSTICSGYADAFKAICDHLDLPCWIIVGTVDDVAHAWNAVLINGEVYYVDCTFGDAVSSRDPYFLFSEDQVASLGYVPYDYSGVPW